MERSKTRMAKARRKKTILRLRMAMRRMQRHGTWDQLS